MFEVEVPDRLLVYSFEPGQPVRDHLFVGQAALASGGPGRKDIHLDANNATFHMKALSTQEYEQWMTSLRSNTPDPSLRPSSNTVLRC